MHGKNSQGLIFFSPAFKQVQNYQSKLLAIVQQFVSLKWFFFFSNADINVPSVDNLLLKYTPDVPPTFSVNRNPVYIYMSVVLW